MDEKKKDLIPVAAIAIFLVIIIILCAVRLSERKAKEDTVQFQPAESVESIQEKEATEPETETETETDEPDSTVAEAKSMEEEETQEAGFEHDMLPSGQAQLPEASSPAVSGDSISAADPFAGAEEVHKTNEEMLIEMAAYWEQGNVEAVEDLAMLAWYRKMSASLENSDTFYYYGDRNGLGQPDGIGIAAYAGNEYYYGSWANGKREGQGAWLKKYVYYDDDSTSDRAYSLHMYMGEWVNDMPNGEGQEHYDLDMKLAAQQDRYLQNVIGTFQNGLYSGEMYLTTLNWDGNQEEWNGLAIDGIWSPYGSTTNKMEIPVCVDVDDDDNYLWIAVRDNKDRGIAELLP